MALNTITSQISEGKALKISNARLNNKKVLVSHGDKLVINFQSILTDYWYYLQQHIMILKFTDSQYRRYRFRPKTLSYDLYGTIELAPLILQINSICSTSEFDLKSVKIFDAEIKSFINEVFNKEKVKMQANEAEVLRDIKAKITSST